MRCKIAQLARDRAGALGSAVRGGYDFANAVHPPAAVNPDLPNPVDPRACSPSG